MIVSHEYKFVIAAPVGLGAGPWLKRIAAEGDPGYLEIIGHPNGVCVPEGCEEYARYFVDSPQHRLPQMWRTRIGTPWEGPVQTREDVAKWLEWYMFGMRRKYLEIAMESPPNGWGQRAADGDWIYFEHPSVLLRTFMGYGNSANGDDAPWGRAEVRPLKMEEFSRGWREVIKRVAPGGSRAKGMNAEHRNTVDLLRWHIPVSQSFYELPEELANSYAKEGAHEVYRQIGINEGFHT